MGNHCDSIAVECLAFHQLSRQVLLYRRVVDDMGVSGFSRGVRIRNAVDDNSCSSGTWLDAIISQLNIDFRKCDGLMAA